MFSPFVGQRKSGTFGACVQARGLCCAACLLRKLSGMGDFLFRFALEGGQVQPVFHGQKAHDDDGAAADEAGADGVEPEEVIAHAVDHATDDAGQGVDLFAEDKGHFVDKDIAKHAAGSSRNGSHDDSHPKWVFGRGGEGLLDAGYGEEGQPDGVEEEPCVVLSH